VKDTTFLTVEEGEYFTGLNFSGGPCLSLWWTWGAGQAERWEVKWQEVDNVTRNIQQPNKEKNINRQNLVCTQNTVDCVWNVMAHAQKLDFVFRRNGRVHLNRRGASVQSTAGSRGVRISGNNAVYTMFRGSVKSTGYPLHSPVSPSRPLPCVTVCHQVSTGLYHCNSSILCMELK